MKKLLFGIMSLVIAANPLYVYADEISVSRNGEGSTSGVNVNVSQATQTQQQNTAEVNNNVDINAETGNNQASGNSSDETSITTGDINVSSNIENTGINASSVEAGCCSSETNIEIKGNGEDSTNTIDYFVNTGKGNNGTNISVNNNANIANNVNGSANTGENSANNNLGSVSIVTGNIYAKDKIKNKSINIYEINASGGIGGNVSLTISDNGSNSNNSITFVNNQNLNIDVNNNANIDNNSKWDLNTGKNQANGNVGDVEIKTGDIYFESYIENGPINVGLIDVECCKLPKGGENPPDVFPPPPPPTQPTQPGGPPGPTGGGGQVAAEVLGEILPVTGNYLMLVLLLGNIVMFFMGGYLRLRSGRSPNFVYAH